MLEAANDQIMAALGDAGGIYASPPLPGPALSATYKDPGEPATETPAALPQRLIDATLDSIRKIRFDESLATQFLGIWLTEPSDNALFEPGADIPELANGLPPFGRITLDRCTRMMYRGRQLFINGEAATVPASATLRTLADARSLDCSARPARRLKEPELEALMQWLEDGWVHYIV
jgi:50S ribosomal protein L16 3-hydroxylase